MHIIYAECNIKAHYLNVLSSFVQQETYIKLHHFSLFAFMLNKRKQFDYTMIIIDTSKFQPQHIFRLYE